MKFKIVFHNFKSKNIRGIEYCSGSVTINGGEHHVEGTKTQVFWMIVHAIEEKLERYVSDAELGHLDDEIHPGENKEIDL